LIAEEELHLKMAQGKLKLIQIDKQRNLEDNRNLLRTIQARNVEIDNGPKDWDLLEKEPIITIYGRIILDSTPFGLGPAREGKDIHSLPAFPYLYKGCFQRHFLWIPHAF